MWITNLAEVQKMPAVEVGDVETASDVVNALVDLALDLIRYITGDI